MSTQQSEADRPQAESKELFLLEALIADFQWAAFELGILTCLLNACSSKTVSWSLRSWRHLLYDDSHVLLLGLRFGRDVGLSPKAVTGMGDVCRGIADAKLRLAPLVQKERLDRLTSLSECADACRKVSVNAVEVMRGLEPDVRQRLNKLYHQNAVILVDFLREGGEGSSRRVDENGRIELPSLVQRRRAARMRVQIPCSLLIGGRSVSATLVDVSKSGVSLICHAHLKDAQRVTIELPDRRRLEGDVVWRDGSRYGMSLAQVLAATDPLFAASARSGARFKAHGSEPSERPHPPLEAARFSAR